VDFPKHIRIIVRRLYLQWYFHSFCYFWNLVALGASFSTTCAADCVGGFFAALIAFLLAPIAVFFIYFAYYTAVRTESSFYFYFWLVAFSFLVLNNLWFLIGLEQFGCGGFYAMLEAFEQARVPAGVIMFFSFGFWATDFFLSIYLLVAGRRTFVELRSASDASKAGSPSGSFQPAEEPPAAPVQPEPSVSSSSSPGVVNFDVMKRALAGGVATATAAVGRVVKENRGAIVQAAVEHRDVVGQVAADNSDAIFANKAAMESVFGS